MTNMVIAIVTHPFGRMLVAVVLTMAFVGALGLVMVVVERKVAGFIQRRPGPFEVGPHGILQSAADGVKLVGKQLVVPMGADRLLFWMAPLLSLASAVVCFLPIPFSPILTGMELNLGVVLVLTFSGLNTLALCLAGWGSNNKYSLLGSARAVSQSVAYEIPLLLAVLAVAFQTGSLNLSAVALEQSRGILSWNIFTQPIAFAMFLISGIAETNRAPFDLPEAESELTAGFHTEYSGMGFGLFFLAEYSYMAVVCAVAVALFLGGWGGPILPGPWWFMAKMSGLLFVMVWFRWTFPRVRFDQLLNVCWKWLIPLGLGNLVLTALILKVAGGS